VVPANLSHTSSLNRLCLPGWGRIRVQLTRLLAVSFALVVLSSASTRAGVPPLRESDQASLVDGAMQLKFGKSKRDPGFYNYDKQYLSYWLSVPPGDLPNRTDRLAVAERAIGWSNLMSGSVALMGFWFVWFSCLRKSSPGRLLTAVTFTLSPVVLLSAAPASAATFSAGFLLALIALLASRGLWLRRARPVLAMLLVFAAVAARADAVLCLPLLCWASFRGRSWRRFRTLPTFWLMLFAAVAALVLGRWLVSEPATTFYGVFFEPKVFSAYVIFGLGGCALLWLVQFTAITTASRQRFHWLGALFLALPLMFYGWQLFSPRHLLTTALVVLGCGFMWKGRALFRFWRSRKPRTVRCTSIAVVVAAALPLLIGIYLPNPSQPRLVFTRATEFPTADGLWPMGATLSFLNRWRHADEVPVDHNQAVAKAALAAHFNCHATIVPVPVMESDMSAYLRLALSLWGSDSKMVSWQEVASGEVPCAFIDLRSLCIAGGGVIHPDRERPSIDLLTNAGLGMQLDSAPTKSDPDLQGDSQPINAQAIVRVIPGGDIDSRIAEYLAVAGLFGGDEFRPAGEVAAVEGESAWQPGDRDGGKSLAFSSRAAFSIGGRRAESQGEWWLLHFSATELAKIGEVSLESHADANVPIRRWLGVLPDYMSRRGLLK